MNNPFQQLNDPSQGWRADALCAQVSIGDEWFAEKGEGGIKDLNFAKFVCGLCPVQSECLQTALETGERWGIWGGVPPRRRAEMRRELGLTGTPSVDVDWHGTEAGAKRHHREGTKVCPRCSRGATLAREERAARAVAS